MIDSSNVLTSLSFLALFTSFFPSSLEGAAWRGAAAESVLSVEAIPVAVGHIPRGAQRVRLLSFALRADCSGDVRVNSIRIHLYGLGDASLIDGLYLLRGYQRLTRAAKVSSSDQTVLLRPRALTIPACETWRLDVAADFAADVDVGSQYRLEVRSPEDIATDASRVEGRFPLRSADRAPRVTPLPAGTLTVTFLPLSGTIHAVTEETLARFTIEADHEAHHLLQAITLSNEGTAKGADVRTLYLTRNRGRALTNTAAKLQRDEVTLTFLEPYFLRRGQSVTFELRAKSFTRDETINFVLKEPSDLQAQSTRRALK